MNSMPKHVVSSTLTDPEWENTTVIDGDVPAKVAKHKEGDGGPILIAGSRTLLHSLIPTGLIDEYRLMIFPVVVGAAGVYGRTRPTSWRWSSPTRGSTTRAS